MYKFIIICVLGAVVQSITCQFIGNAGIVPCRSPVVTSATLGPGGTVNICSDDLIISGPLTVSGKLPFSGTVTLEGSLPAVGAGVVNYECGEPVVKETPAGFLAGYGYL